ncbi:hypothetical protein L0991_20400 [Vibrio chagasii]|uniref:hypothetical protein n=1 Tax=Vibrio chagasii TaxID=170679 RepID=UPI0035A57419
MSKILLPLVIGVSSITTSAYANEDNNLQGYYKSKAAIKFAVDKIQQNKVEFMNLDEAISSLTANSSPQTLSSIDDIANSKSAHSDIFLAKSKEFNLNNQVCVITKDGATIAFEVEDGAANCAFDVNKVDKAMAKTTSGLVFFTRYGSADETQYSIDKISLNGQEISNTFLFKFKGKLVGDLAKVKKAPSGEFTIEHYMDYGSEDGQKIGYRAYQWADNFADGQDAIVNSFAYLYGSNVSLENTKTPYFWAIKDTVSPSKGNSDFYFASTVSRMARSTDNKITQKDKYSKQSPSDLIAYNFNNANKLVGLSPDACTIKQIADGEKTLTWYKGFNRDENCTATAADLAGREKVTSATLTNDGSKKISATSLNASALETLKAVDLESSTASDLTDSDFAAMKAKYDGAVKKYSNFNSIQFWK